MASPAKAADTPAVGGDGGGTFRVMCPPGQYLAGLEVWATKVIDEVLPWCASLDDKGRFGAGRRQQSISGRFEGKSKKALCGPDTYVAGLRVARSDNMVVSSIQVSCHRIETGAVAEATCASPSGKCLGKASAQCGSEEAAVGIHGRSSESLNAIGLACGPRPGLVAPTPVAEVPAAEPEAPDAPPSSDNPVTPVVMTPVKPGDTFRSCPECPEMVVVPAGEFMMGSPESEPGRLTIEGPQHKVTIAKPFAVGKFEVTFAQWDACVAAGACAKVDDNGWGRGDRPVINVTYDQVVAYNYWLSQKTGKDYRFLSEAQWEYAARAGSTGRWSFGDDESKLGVYAQWTAAIASGSAGTEPVGQKKPNAFGLYDMHGNVYELVWDSFHVSYEPDGPPTDGSPWLSSHSPVIRGGASGWPLEYTRSAHRLPYGSGTNWIGFRVAMILDDQDLVPAEEKKAEAPAEIAPPVATPPAPIESETPSPPSDVAEKPAQWVPPVAEIAPPYGTAEPEAAATFAPPPEPAAEAAPPPEAPASSGADVDEDVASSPPPTRGFVPPSPSAATAPRAPGAAPMPPMPRPEAATAPPAAQPAPTMAAPVPERRLAKKKKASPGPAAAPQPAAPPDADGKWRLVPVFFGTDRAQQAGATRLSYGYDRARRLEVGRALVSVPTSHQAPNVERPWAFTIPGTSIKLYEEAEDPEKHFTMREIKAMSQDELVKLVKERLKASKTYKDQALIFIHGYNSSFDNAVYRAAQLAHDLEFDGAPFLYSWPSRGELSGYTYDRASNEQAEPFMREFVEMVIKKSGAKSVNIVAHSMGNQLTVRVLQQLKAAKVKVNQIVLAAPDVDRDSFENIARELKGLSKGITLYAAGNDKALIASKTFHGGVARAGDVPASGPVVVEGVDTIDVTTLSTDTLGLNHSSYAEKTALIDDIARLLRTGERPAKRTPVLTRVPAGKLEYWKYPAP